MRVLLRLAVVVAVVSATASDGAAQGRRGPPNDVAFRADRALFHYLLEHRDGIRRCVKRLDNGVETVTESDDEEISAKIREHVASMYKRVEQRRPIHLRDPLFAEIFRHAEKIQMDIEETDHGVKVRETSDDPYVVQLIQEHARVVSLFLKKGHREVRKNHPVPRRTEE